MTFPIGVNSVLFEIVLLNSNSITIKEFTISITPGELLLRNNNTVLMTITGADGK